MTAFDSTVSGATSTSYIDVASADAYFGARRNADAWTSLTATADKQLALMAATQRLEQLKYCGTRTTSAQRLKWPRYGLVDDDNWPYPHTAIPRPVVEATCEMALHLLNSGADDPLIETGLENLRTLAAGGGLSLGFRDDTVPGALPVQVRRLLRGMIEGGDGRARLVRG